MSTRIKYKDVTTGIQDTTILYRYFSKDSTLLYVGISTQVIRRLLQHQITKEWASKITTITLTTYPTLGEAMVAEIEAIESEHPLHNVKYNEVGIQKRLKIPMSARTHPQGLRDIGKVALLNKIPSLVIVANTLITMLKSKKQNNVVEASYAEIAEIAGVSVRTVNNSVAILLKEAYISKLGKQSYFISPNLAWFGNQVDWSVALFKLEQGTELSKVAKMYGENTLLERQVT